MLKVVLGKTGIKVNKNGFGALPIQRISVEESAAILQKAYENGIDYFDTARDYTDSEYKIGYALAKVRSQIIIATKSSGQTSNDIKKDFVTSLKYLNTDYIDVFQLHNPPFCPKPGDGSGIYETLLELQAEGKIRFIGITNHRLNVAMEAALSGLYDTLQFPFSYLAGEKELELVKLCNDNNIGFIAMKSLAGGLIKNSRIAYNWMAEYNNVLPIWGVQKISQLDEFLQLQTEQPTLYKEDWACIELDRKELSGDFCRGCGYCMPCPREIDIANCARATLLLQRAPIADLMSAIWQNKMAKINDCTNCGSCAKQCPYGLDTPALLRKNQKFYDDFIQNKLISE